MSENLTSVVIDGVKYTAPHEVLELLRLVSVERDELLALTQPGNGTVH